MEAATTNSAGEHGKGPQGLISGRGEDEGCWRRARGRAGGAFRVRGWGEATGFKTGMVTSIPVNQRATCLLPDASLNLQRILEGVKKWRVGASPLGAGILAADHVGHTDSRKRDARLAGALEPDRPGRPS